MDSMDNNNSSKVQEATKAEEADNLTPKQKTPRYALIPAILGPLCLFFPYGYSIGTINAASGPLRDFYNESHVLRFGSPISHGTLDLLWALTAALFPLGGVFGSFLVRPMMAKFGRRRTLLLFQSVCVLGSLLMAVSMAFNSYETLIVGRFVVGIYGAIASGVGPVYVAEISANHIRGIAGSLFAVSVTVGILMGNVLGLKEILGTSTGWPYLLAITCVPSILFLSYGPWLPESPRSLYLDEGKHEEAAEILRKLRGTDDVSEEINALRQQASAVRSKPMTIKQVLKTGKVRRQVISTIVILSAFQLCGMSGMQFYMDDVFVIAGIPEDIVVYVTLGTVALQVLLTLLGGFLLKKCGRKTLLLVGYATLSISMIFYTFMAGFQYAVPWFSYISVVAVMCFIVGFCVGPASTTYVIPPEILDQATRPAAMTLGVLGLWSSFALIGFVTPYMFEYLKFATFLPYVVITAAVFVYIYLIVPETKGRTLLEVQALFEKKREESVTSVTEPVYKVKKDNPAFLPPTYDEAIEILETQSDRL